MDGRALVSMTARCWWLPASVANAELGVLDAETGRDRLCRAYRNLQPVVKGPSARPRVREPRRYVPRLPGLGPTSAATASPGARDFLAPVAAFRGDHQRSPTARCSRRYGGRLWRTTRAARPATSSPAFGATTCGTAEIATANFVVVSEPWKPGATRGYQLRATPARRRQLAPTSGLPLAAAGWPRTPSARPGTYRNGDDDRFAGLVLLGR